MLDAGKYYGHAVEAVLGTTSTGKDQIAVVFELDEPVGQRITWYGYFTEATEDRTIESLRATGWKGLDFSVFAYGNELPADVTETVELVVEHEQGNDGIWRAKVRWVNKSSGLTVRDPMDAPRAAQFAQRMRARLAAFDAKIGAKPTPKATPKPKAAPSSAPVSDDDIPF